VSLCVRRGVPADVSNHAKSRSDRRCCDLPGMFLQLPRHFADSNIALSDGTTVVQTENVELSPSVSRDGKLVAYTVLKENKSEAWTVAVDGTHPTFRAAGSEPRITADGFHLLYTHSDLQGNEDIWRVVMLIGNFGSLPDSVTAELRAEKPK